MRRSARVGLVVLLTLVAVAYGLVAGHYELFPYEVLRVSQDFITELRSEGSDPNQLEIEDRQRPPIDIAGPEDATRLRQRLVDYIWSGQGFPQDVAPSSVEQDIVDDRFGDLPDLDRMDRITVSMDHGVDSVAYLFHPEEPKDELIVYHQGHGGDFINGSETIGFFLDRGYTVLALSMPLLGMNSQPTVVLPDFGEVDLVDHDLLELLETDQLAPVKFFLEPIAVALNYIDAELGPSAYHMVGISGGGWTTGLYSAIDPRVSHSYSVAGSVPMYLRSITGDIGDYEQMHSDVYHLANYLEVYVLASSGEGREFVQVFNEFDPCCFSGDAARSYEGDVRSRVDELGPGAFEVFIDGSHRDHAISQESLDFIAERLP